MLTIPLSVIGAEGGIWYLLDLASQLAGIGLYVDLFSAHGTVLEPFCITHTSAHLSAGLVEQIPGLLCYYGYPAN